MITTWPPCTVVYTIQTLKIVLPVNLLAKFDTG